jgi:hypothetical protein
MGKAPSYSTVEFARMTGGTLCDLWRRFRLGMQQFVHMDQRLTKAGG